MIVIIKRLSEVTYAPVVQSVIAWYLYSGIEQSNAAVVNSSLTWSIL